MWPFTSKPKTVRFYMVRFRPEWWAGTRKKGKKSFNKIFGEDGSNILMEISGVTLENNVTNKAICPQMDFDMWMERLSDIGEGNLAFFIDGETYKNLKLSENFLVTYEEDFTTVISEKIGDVQFIQKFKANKEAIVKKLGLHSCDDCSRPLSSYLGEQGRCIACSEYMASPEEVREITNNF